MKDYRHTLAMAASAFAILTILTYSILNNPPSKRVPVRPMDLMKRPEVEKREVEIPELKDQVMSSDQFLYNFNFRGQLVDIEPVGPPGELEYLSDIEDLERRGFSISPSDKQRMEIGRGQEYDLKFRAYNGSLIAVRGFRAGAHAEGKVEMLLFKDGVYPQDIRSMHIGAGIN